MVWEGARVGCSNTASVLEAESSRCLLSLNECQSSHMAIVAARGLALVGVCCCVSKQDSNASIHWLSMCD